MTAHGERLGGHRSSGVVVGDQGDRRRVGFRIDEGNAGPAALLVNQGLFTVPFGKGSQEIRRSNWVAGELRPPHRPHANLCQ